MSHHCRMFFRTPSAGPSMALLSVFVVVVRNKIVISCLTTAGTSLATTEREDSRPSTNHREADPCGAGFGCQLLV